MAECILQSVICANLPYFPCCCFSAHIYQESPFGKVWVGRSLYGQYHMRLFGRSRHWFDLYSYNFLVFFVVVIIAFIVIEKRYLFSFCFLIKIIHLLNMTFAHLLCCCYFVFKDINYFIKQESQLDRFLETLQILTS